MSSTNSSLRPAWRNQSGGRGFQPPPSVASERGRPQPTESSGEIGDNRTVTSNKFSALDDDEEAIEGERSPAPKGNSRSEALRQGLGSRPSSLGKSGGRRLADLAATAPDRSAAYSGGGGRFSASRPTLAIEEGKVIRFTRERLLSMRPAPSNTLPEELQPLEGNAIISNVPQDPVCWDNFEAEEIWATVPLRRPAKPAAVAGRSLSEMADGAPPIRGRKEAGPAAGRWQRGVALPPPSASEKARKEKEAANPDDLWDDPTAAPAIDFSAFGDDPKEEQSGEKEDEADTVFDFEKMAEESRMLEDERHGNLRSRASSEGTELDGDDGSAIPAEVKQIDPHRPLASVGTTIRSGSGDNVNVFEDFDEPVSSDSTPTAAPPKESSENVVKEPNNVKPSSRTEDEATSRLMAMIGVSGSVIPDDTVGTAVESGTAVLSTPDPLSVGWGDPEKLVVQGLSIPLNPLNPWGGALLGQSNDSIAGVGALLQSTDAPVKGLDLQARLRQAEEEQKIRKEEMEKRRIEEEARKRAVEADQQQRMQQQRMQQQQQQQTDPQRQQPAGVQNQVELVLMERISIILENSWGRSDLVSVLTTLHAEDSRVIPLLDSIEALRALIMRHSSRVALRQDPTFGSEMAVLLLTNAQWQQQQLQRQESQQAQAQQQAEQEALRARQEEIRLREQRRQEVERKQQAKPLVPGAPWYYSDPQQNIQGPFRGQEMRQWLEAGYFKGDLPVSQDGAGPFRPLSMVYPDLSLAFLPYESNTVGDEEVGRSRAVEKEKESLQAKAKIREQDDAEERLRLENEQRQREAADELERQRATRENGATADTEDHEPLENSNGGNHSSAQLKMMLGLPAQSQQHQDHKEDQSGSIATDETTNDAVASKKPKKKASTAKIGQTSGVAVVPESSFPAKPAAPAWGGAKKSPSRKGMTMSEIQQEEARRSALYAMERSRSGPSSGWANVAASKSGPSAKSGPSGWNGAAAKITPAVVVTKPSLTKPAMPKPSNAIRSRSVPTTNSSAQVGAPAKQTSPAAADDFGAKMSPALEKWCREQMLKLNGTDDLTLLSFCMTLNDPNEIHQYLATYLGASPQVNNFANEFIQRKVGVKPVKEEWETTVNTKRKGKKKSTGR